MNIKVTFIVIAYNAEGIIDNLLNNLKKQTYNHKKIEVILVDSNSTDNTKKIMKQFEKECDFSRVCILDNPKKILPCGWNIALDESTGDIILRLDVHTSIPNDFIEKNVKCIEGGEKICGGKLTSIIKYESRWKIM